MAGSLNKKYIIILILFFTAISFSQGTWERLNTPTKELLRKIVFTDSLNGWAAGSNGVIIHTTDGGNSWIIENSGVSTFIIDLFFINKNLGWAVTWTDELPYRTVILKTTNGGDEWSSQDFPENNKFMNTIMFFDSMNGYMGGPGIFKTTTGGSSWSAAQIDSSTISNLPVYNFSFYNRKFGYACGGFRDNAGVIWKTTDYGNNWEPKGVGPEPLYAIHISDSLNALGIIGDPEAIYGVGRVRTTNAGSTWDYDSLNIFAMSYDLSFRTQSEGWTASGVQFLFTSDSGNFWQKIITPDTVSIYDINFPDSSVGYACGDSGVILKYTPSFINNIKLIQKDKDIGYNLYQNYPNPFNPETSIEFDISNPSFVTLKVFDILGNEVALLLNEEKSKGKYSVRFNGKNLPSGVYFYKLITKKYSITKKMLLIK